MFCPKCGKMIDESDLYCRNCGYKLVSIAYKKLDSNVEKKTISCPECNGPLEELDGLDTYICLHCGNKVVLSGMSDAAYGAKIDLKKMDQEERMQNNILSHEKALLKMQTDYISKESKTKRTMIIAWSLIGLLLVLVLIFIFAIYPKFEKDQLMKQMTNLSEDVDAFVENQEFDKAESSNILLKEKVEKLDKEEWITWMNKYLTNSYKITLGRRKQTGEKAKKVILKNDLEAIDDMDSGDVVDYLVKQGFVNISCASRKAKFYQEHYYEVDDITIEGEDDYYAGEIFVDDVEVTIWVLVH